MTKQIKPKFDIWTFIKDKIASALILSALFAIIAFGQTLLKMPQQLENLTEKSMKQTAKISELTSSIDSLENRIIILETLQKNR